MLFEQLEPAVALRVGGQRHTCTALIRRASWRISVAKRSLGLGTRSTKRSSCLQEA
jgi:hypothetical protein